jgi:hypothetical protein
MLLAGSRQTPDRLTDAEQTCTQALDRAVAVSTAQLLTVRRDSPADPATLCAAKQWETDISITAVLCCAAPATEHAVTPPRRPPSTYDARQPLSGTGHCYF